MTAPEASKKIRAALKARAEHSYRVTIGSGDKTQWWDHRNVYVQSARKRADYGTGYGTEDRREPLTDAEREELARLFKLPPADATGDRTRSLLIIQWHELGRFAEAVEDTSEALSDAQAYALTSELFERAQAVPTLHVETREELEQRHRDEESARHREEQAARSRMRDALEAYGWDIERAAQAMGAVVA